MTAIVTALCTGRIAPLDQNRRSAIVKRPVEGLVAIRTLGLDGDQQADKRHHGGPDMAVHHYPHDHYPYWREHLGDHPALEGFAAFGSNIVATGLLEHEVLLGDRFRLGTALLEACQPRQPCATIERRFDRKGMVAAILESGRCGWFYRVIEEGEAQAGARLDRTERGDADWSMARMFDVLWANRDPAALRSLRGHSSLPEKLGAKIDQYLG